MRVLRSPWMKRTVAVGIVDGQRTGGEWIYLLAEYSNDDDCLSSMNEKNHFIAKNCSQKSVNGTDTDTIRELGLVWVHRMNVVFSGGNHRHPLAVDWCMCDSLGGGL